jgi:hypothetical protein
MNGRRAGRLASLCAIAISALLAGCASDKLPEVPAKLFAHRVSPIPQGAAPLYSWHRLQTGLKTYWRDQEVNVQVRAYFPPDWKKPGDEFWEMTARNGEGRAIRFIGVERKYLNENGTELSMLMPKLDLNSVPDSLYLEIAPNIKTSEGRIVAVQPIAWLIEIRNHTFEPFQFPIKLIPGQESPLTPKPELPPEPPAGTPIRAE